MESFIGIQLNQVQNLFRKYGIQHAYLFGSAARGTMNENSDVDFLIRFEDGLDFETYSNNYFSLLYALQDLLKRDVELITEDTLTNPYFIESINRDKVPLL